MRVEKNKAFAYRVSIGDYNHLQCNYVYSWISSLKITIWTLKQNIVENIVFLKINEPGVPNIGHVGRKKSEARLKLAAYFFLT